LIVKAGLKQGLEPADVIGAIVDHSHLEGEDISNVRLLDRFSFVEVPASRAEEVASTVSGKTVRGVSLKLEVAKR
jgi:ATP-dependent RNA helicase DeaD